MSQPATEHHPAPRSPASAGGGVNLQTLWITAVASAAAAFACSKVWASGTLAAAAFTPVLVALIKEGLAKSTAVVAKAVPPVRGVVRSARVEDAAGSAAAGSAAAGAAAAGSASAPGSAAPVGESLPPVGSLSGDAPSQPPAWVAPSATTTWNASQQPGRFPVDAPDDAAGRVAQAGEVTYHGSASRRRGWRLAIVTGLLGFLVGAVIITVPELVAGSSASGGGSETTLFGGSTSHKHVVTKTVTTETQTTTVPATKTVTTAPAETVTAPAPTVTAPPPTTTVPPAAAQQTAPTTTTPAPAVAEPSVPQPPG